MGHHHEHHIIHRSDYARIIAIILLLCLLVAAGYALQHTISCFLLSWVIAYLLDPLVVQMERRNIRRIVALGILYVVLSILTFFFLTFAVPKITISWDGFIRDLPDYISRIQLVVQEWKEHLPDRYGADEIQWLLDKGSANVDTAAETAASKTYGFATRIFFNLFNIVLSPVLVFFMLYYKQTVMVTLSSWIPEQRREIVLSIAREVNSSIGGYLRGQVIVSLIVALMAAPCLYFLDIPHPLFCGIFAGFASILPFIGVILATLPALFFAWFKFQTITMLTQTGALFGVIYFLEGYIIKPLVFKESMNLNPLVTIIMVMALGETLGFWGILLALPIASALKIAWGHVLKGDFSQ